MKVTGIALLVIAFALLLFAGTSYLILAEPPASGTPEPAPPSAMSFSPLIALIVGAISGIAGAAILKFGGKGYSEKTVAPMRTS